MNLKLEDLLEGQKKPTLPQVAWILGCLNESLSLGGCSFRYTIYELMGFGPEAYMPLYCAGGMNVTNAIFGEAEQSRVEKVREERSPIMFDPNVPFEEYPQELKERLEAAWRRGFMECTDHLKAPESTFGSYLREGKDRKHQP